MLQENQMVNVAAARKAARKAIESTYEGVCSIVEYKAVTDGETKITRHKEITVLEKQPCKLSFEKLNAVVQTDTAAAISQGTKLFISPEITINSGSKIVVVQNGVTGEYSASGEPAVYASHQEIVLQQFKGWA
jgi:hypothetical protein